MNEQGGGNAIQKKQKRNNKAFCNKEQDTHADILQGV